MNTPHPAAGLTFEALLDLLALVDDQDWTPNSNGQLRNSEGQCPLCALWSVLDPACDEKFLPISYFRENFARGVPEALGSMVPMCEVMEAADRPRTRHRPALLAALGLAP